jgi:transportin-3
MVNLEKEDKKEMSEAISHLLSAVPHDNLGQALDLFCMPVVQKIHEYVAKGVPVGDDISQIMMMNGIRGI